MMLRFNQVSPPTFEWREIFVLKEWCQLSSKGVPYCGLSVFCNINAGGSAKESRASRAVRIELQVGSVFPLVDIALRACSLARNVGGKPPEFDR